jgi:hypothetical protein
MRLLIAGFGVCVVAGDFVVRLGVCFGSLFALVDLGFYCFEATSISPIKKRQKQVPTYLRNTAPSLK